MGSRARFRLGTYQGEGGIGLGRSRQTQMLGDPWCKVEGSKVAAASRHRQGAQEVGAG